jgi:hypothetical protein
MSALTLMLISVLVVFIIVGASGILAAMLLIGSVD